MFELYNQLQRQLDIELLEKKICVTYFFYSFTYGIHYLNTMRV